MKKFIAIILSVVMVGMLTGCAEYTFEEKEIICTVKSCDEGTFVPNLAYKGLASSALMKKDITKFAMYENLARSTGKYEYKVTVTTSEGAEYVVIRNEAYEVGAEIVVKQICSYCDGELIEIEYK